MLGRKAGTRGIQKAKEREKSKVRNIFIVLMEWVCEAGKRMFLSKWRLSGIRFPSAFHNTLR